jgi:hypothetical protein
LPDDSGFILDYDNHIEMDAFGINFLKSRAARAATAGRAIVVSIAMERQAAG